MCTFVPVQLIGCGNDSKTVATGNEQVIYYGNEALYKFDEESGATAINSSFDELHGAIFNAVRVTGKVGNALSFDAPGSSYVELDILRGNSDEFFITFPEDKITIDAWVKLTSLDLGTYYQIFGGSDTGLQSFRLFIDNGKLGFLLFRNGNPADGETLIITSNTIFSVDVWYHIALAFDGSQAIIYINGSEDNYRAIIHPVSRVYNNLYIGGPGIIDEFRFTASLKTADEILSYYNSTK